MTIPPAHRQCKITLVKENKSYPSRMNGFFGTIGWARMADGAGNEKFAAAV